MKKSYCFALLFCSFSFMIQGQGTIKVVTSASIFQDMAKEVGKSRIEAISIVSIGGDPHTYEPRPSDAALVSSADLILVNGLNFEGWISELIENSGTKAKVVTITEGVIPIASPTYQNAYDPHAWMSAQNGRIYVDNILKALIEIDPAGSQTYASNAEKYRKSLEDLDTYILKSIADIPASSRILITSHDAFSYYGQRYGIEVSGVMGISTDAEAQTSDIRRITKTITERKVPAVFIESTINPKLLQQIAADNDVIIGGELYADSIGPLGSEGDSYYKMLKHNTDVIVKALKKEGRSATKIDDDKSEYNFILYMALGLLMVVPLIFLLIKSRKQHK